MICDNLEQIKANIAIAAEKSGRHPNEVQLLAVSKRMDITKIKDAWGCGQHLFGENFVQEAKEKIEQLDPDIIWHFIGHLQTNKAKTAVQLFQLIETVDRFKLAQMIDRYAGELAKTMDILIQVNVGREKQKSGVLPLDAEEFIQRVSSLNNIRIRGLMTIPPFSQDPEKSRSYFRSLKKMADDFTNKGYFSTVVPVILSMGMSADYTVAIEEGSTLVRVGTAIFGPRPA